MYRLVETIRLLNGMFYNLPYHQERMNASVFDLYGRENSIRLQNHLEHIQHPLTGLFKCRVVYDKVVQHIEFTPYSLKSIESLKAIPVVDIEYAHKFEDRSVLDNLYQMRAAADDIIIIKNGFVMDSYNANLIFFNGKEWITPDAPLLKGTMREYLLRNGKIKAAPIRVQNLNEFKSCRLINALRGFDCPELSISRIVF